MSDGPRAVPERDRPRKGQGICRAGNERGVGGELDSVPNDPTTGRRRHRGGSLTAAVHVEGAGPERTAHKVVCRGGSNRGAVDDRSAARSEMRPARVGILRYGNVKTRVRRCDVQRSRAWARILNHAHNVEVPRGVFKERPAIGTDGDPAIGVHVKAGVFLERAAVDREIYGSLLY